MTEAVTRPGVKRGTIPVFATATAITVSNIYFTQPLLDEIAKGFGISASAAVLVATTGQIGYALGIVAIVPLADSVRLPRLSVLLLAVIAATLLAGAFAPSVALPSMTTLVLSASTVLPQVIMPTVVSMAAPGHVGRVLGAVGTGLTMGALLSRTAAGLITEATGTWRASFVVAAVATGALLLVLPRYMPAERPLVTEERPSHLRLLAGTRLPPQRGTNGVGARCHRPVQRARRTATRYSGRLTDRWEARRVNALSLGSALLAFALFGLADQSVIALAVGCYLLGTGRRAARSPTGHVPSQRVDQFLGRLNRGTRGGRPPGFDRCVCRRRNLVERCFNRPKKWRGLATRYDKTRESYQAAVTIASVLLWI